MTRFRLAITRHALGWRYTIYTRAGICTGLASTRQAAFDAAWGLL